MSKIYGCGMLGLAPVKPEFVGSMEMLRIVEEINSGDPKVIATKNLADHRHHLATYQLPQ